MTSARMAIVHEWIAARAGSEQVFEALAALYPKADLYALTREPAVHLDLDGRDVRTTFLDRSPLRTRRGLSLPLMPLAWRAMPAGSYDIVITSHHAFAATNRLARDGAPHLAYVHTPARYLWTPELDSRGNGPWLAPARRAMAAVERRAASHLTSIAANSAEVAKRIQRFWAREARVIHPPVDTAFFAQQAPPTMDLPLAYLLGLGRWIPYKNHLTVIDVAEQAGLPAVIAGSGPLEAALRRRAASARVPVVIIKSPTREQVRELLQSATSLVFPTMEDFGIVPVEAMASGTPVVAFADGGALETVVDGKSGALVRDHSVEQYADAVKRIETISPSDCVMQASRFSKEQFSSKVCDWVDQIVSQPTT